MISPGLIQEVVQELPSLITENDLHVSQVLEHVQHFLVMSFLTVLVGVTISVIDDGDVSYSFCKKCEWLDKR